MSLKKSFVFVTASILSLLLALSTPAFAQRGGGGGGGHPGGGAPGGGSPGGGGGHPGGPGPGGGGGHPGGPGPGGPGHYPGGGHYPVYGYGYRYYGYPYYGYGYPYYYGWYGYPYFYASWGWPYGPYPYYYGYGYPAGGYDGAASLRLDVTPKEAEVYVDGYMAGTVDDFDGTFQRLRVPPGSHELTLYRDGFKTVHQSLQVSAGSTFKVSYKMEPLAAGEVAEARPVPPPPPPDENEGNHVGPPERRPSQQAPPRQQPPAVRSATGFGTLAIRVQPSDAIVLIDGERWQTSSGQDRLIVEVPEGAHRIEIRKDGFDPYLTDVTVGEHQTMPINVSLHSR